MKKNENKKKLFTTLIIPLIILGCNFNSNPIGGIENNPLENFIGNSYKSQYEEIISISQKESIIVHYAGNGNDEQDTIGEIIDSKVSENNEWEGTLYLLKCSNHSNSSSFQFPNYNEENPHKNCYTILYIKSISQESIMWGYYYNIINGKGTTCFNTKENALEYFYFDQNIWKYLSEGSINQ